MATRDELYQALRNADAAGDTEGARKLAAYIKSMPADGAAPAAPKQQTAQEVAAEMRRGGQQFDKDALGGIVRGAAGIGATLLAPVDAAARALGVQNNWIGRTDRREAIDAGLQRMGVDTNSGVFKTAKLGTEIAATAPVGGLIARGAAAVPGVAQAAPNLLTAIRTGGMEAGGGNLLTRAAGGAITGGASAGLINPDDAATGAAVGAALPVAARGAGAVGNAIGRAFRGPEQPLEVSQAVQAARDAGYVIPPSQARPSLVNRTLEGFSGKITTAQNASARNQTVTNDLVKRELGLPPDAPLSLDNLDAVRAQAGQAYGAISKLGKFNAYSADLPDAVHVARGTDPLTLAKTAEVDAGELVRAWKQANSDANAYYKAYGRDANPETLAKAKAAASDAKKVDAFLEKQLQAAGQTDMLQALKDARVLIAKTYSAEKALNPTTGNIDARKLAGELKKGKPLSGGFKEAGDFAARFPKASQPVEGMGSLPQTSPLDWALGGSLSAATANPLAMASVMARPAARSLVLSPAVQDRLIQGAANPLAALLNPELVQFGYRAAPVALGGQ